MLTLILVFLVLFFGYRLANGSVLENGLLSMVSIVLFVVLDNSIRGLPVMAYVTVFIILFSSLQFILPAIQGKVSLQSSTDAFRVSVGRMIFMLSKQSNGTVFMIGVTNNV